MAEDTNERREAPPITHRASQLTAIAGVIAAMIPLTAAVNGCFSLRLEREKYLSELRLKYVDRALDPARDPGYREGFFMFILDTTSHADPLYRWAKNRLQNAQQVIKLREQVMATTAQLSQIAESLVKERASHAQDKTAATAREQALRQTARVALRQRVASEEELRHAEAAGGYRGAGSQPSSSSLQDTSTADSQSDDPKITSAYCLHGSSSIHIEGSRFGSEWGTVYLGAASKTQVFGQPRKLSIRSWSNTNIVADGSFPRGGCAMDIGLRGEKVWVQTPHFFTSEPVDIFMM